VHAPADGYTLLMAGSFNATNVTLYEKLNFNFIRNIAPVAGVFRGPYALVVNTPAEIVEKLNKEVNAGLADPKIKARLLDLGGDVLALSPADFGKFIAYETEKWAKVIKFAGIKAD